jgi:1-acyl-sn-glycerol-3-phosphate acyltransferase
MVTPHVTRYTRGGITPQVVRLRGKRSLGQRVLRRGRELREAAPQLDVPWARSWVAGVVRAGALRFVLRPVMNVYTRRRATGRDKLSRVKGPVILVANHTSHIDTPIILAALPRRLRKRTAVAAAADYFYRNKVFAAAVSLFFNTVPIERKGGGLGKQAAGHLDRLLDEGWNLLVYPQGTRRTGGTGRVRRGAAVLANRHRLPVVPIRVTGTGAVMPPGRLWPKRLRGKVVSKRHRVQVAFGEPITELDDAGEVIERVQRFFDGQEGDRTGRFRRRKPTVRVGEPTG